MKTASYRRAFSTVLLGAVVSLVSLCGQAQEAGKRRLVNQVAPVYPALARRMSLEGVVKVDALVNPDGSVKTVEIKGGSPILTQSAVDAVRQWKWVAASQPSHEIVEVKFSPQ